MRVLWLCNIMLPVIANKLNEKVNPYGGWLTGLLDDLAYQVEIAVCFPYSKGNPIVHGKAGEVFYYGYKEIDDNSELFVSIINDYSPDLIHIWGTEFKHSLDMVNAAEKTGLLDNAVINIQGLVSIYGKYHYYCGMPEKVYKSSSLREKKKRNNIVHRKKNFEAKGIFEIEAIKKARHVIGRTDWDEACTKQINPLVNYHFCNESLRYSFYENEWDINKCQKHSIFVSQSNYPIKGFHLMLEAMPLILERFPDAHLYTTGNEPKKPDGWKYNFTYNSYSNYIRSLLDKYKLDKHVTFNGFLDEKAMCERFLKSNLFVSPSSIENESNSISEAKLLGMPVVSSYVGGVTNRITHKFDGYLYQWDAPYMLAYFVCKVFEDDYKAMEIGSNARKNALIIHNRKNNVEKMLNIYKEILFKNSMQK